MPCSAGDGCDCYGDVDECIDNGKDLLNIIKIKKILMNLKIKNYEKGII